MDAPVTEPHPRPSAPPVDRTPDAPRPAVRLVMGALGVWLLVMWGVLWIASFRHDELVPGPRGRVIALAWPKFAAQDDVWFPASNYHSMDFVHAFAGARVWLRGADPYVAIHGDPMSAEFSWPPIVLPLYAWTGLFPFTPIGAEGNNGSGLFLAPAAAAVQTALLGAIVLLAARAATRTRTQLGLVPLPWVFVAGALAMSTPVLFAMERGNLDLLVVAAIIGAVALLGSSRPWAEIAAGAALAIAVSIKVYPVFLVFALVALRRWRVAAAFVVACVALPLLQWRDAVHWLRASGTLAALTGAKPTAGVAAVVPDVTTSAHAIFDLWPRWVAGTPLARVPARVAALACVVPLVGFVVRRVSAAEGRAAVALPLMAWVVAVATFVPNVSNDYNFAVLPLALLCLVDARDPAWIWLALAPLLVWWQPLALAARGSPGIVFFDVETTIAKVVATLVAGWLVVRRADEASRAAA